MLHSRSQVEGVEHDAKRFPDLRAVRAPASDHLANGWSLGLVRQRMARAVIRMARAVIGEALGDEAPPSTGSTSRAAPAAEFCFGPDSRHR